MWRIPFRDGAFPHTVDSLSGGSILHAADISHSGGSISHAAGISPSGGSISHAAGISPSGGSILHAAVARRGSIHSCEGHAPLLALPPPPGHAAVLRCGMCCFAGEVMYSTVLVVVGCADMSGCSTVISLLTNTNTISHNLSIHITSYPPL